MKIEDVTYLLLRRILYCYIGKIECCGRLRMEDLPLKKKLSNLKKVETISS